jgi:hypothetical protein
MFILTTLSVHFEVFAQAALADEYGHLARLDDQLSGIPPELDHHPSRLASLEVLRTGLPLPLARLLLSSGLGE